MSILKNFLDFAGLSAYDNKIKQIINSKVAKIKMNNNTLTPDSSGEINLGNIATTSVASDSADGLMSKEDYTRLKNVAAGAEVNVQSDWDQTTSSADDFIKNKPTLGTAAAKNYTTSVTNGSSDLVTSDGIYNAIDEVESVAETLIKDTVGWSGKNLLDYDVITSWREGGLITANNDVLTVNYQDNISEGTETDFLSLPAGTFTISWNNACRFQIAVDGVKIVDAFNVNHRTFTLDSASDRIHIKFIASSYPFVIGKLQIEHGTDVTTWSPYHATVDEAKADKVTNATSGHLAGLDSNGNLTDSGHSDADYVHKTGNEDITGNKHFTGDVIVDGNIIGKKGTIYGFHIDNTEDDPDEKITYMYDAVGMKPAKMNFTTGKFDYGSWENAFFMPRPCMLKFDGTVDYYLDPNDYSKKEDGTASDVADLTYGANAMMEWGRDGKKIWVKIEPTSNDKKSANILIADYQVDSDYKAWSFINNQGNLVDHFYTAIYKGSLDSNNRMRSISGQDYNNYVNNKTRQEEVVLAEANNPSTDKLWYTDLKCDRDLINFLTMLMFKSTDIQAKLGEGRTGFSWAQSNVATTGIMNDKGLFYGESSSTGLGCKLFGREQPYGDIWMAEAGFLNVNGTPKTKLTYGTQDGSTANGYNFDGTGYTAIDVTLSSASANYISEMIYDSSYGMVPVAIGGNEHIDYCDALWTNNSQTNYALRGGDLNDGRRCGAFCLNLSNVAGIRTRDIGAALSCKPLA